MGHRRSSRRITEDQDIMMNLETFKNMLWDWLMRRAAVQILASDDNLVRIYWMYIYQESRQTLKSEFNNWERGNGWHPNEMKKWNGVSWKRRRQNSATLAGSLPHAVFFSLPSAITHVWAAVFFLFTNLWAPAICQTLLWLWQFRSEQK